MFVRQYTIFATAHPVVLLVYCAGGMVFSLLGMSPLVLVINLAGGLVLQAFYMGVKATRTTLKLGALIMLPIVLLNMVSNSGGLTVLFRAFNRNFTLESLLYGLLSGGVFLAMVVWIRCVSAIFSSEKFLYLFGSRFPNSALLFSLILKQFPDTKYRVDAIHLAQNPQDAPSSRRGKIKTGVRRLSTLLEWSMEDGIEAADSMKARGYGRGKRSSYQQYRFSGGDVGLLVVCSLLLAVVIPGILLEKQAFRLFPTWQYSFSAPGQRLSVLVLLTVYYGIPLLLELRKRGGHRRVSHGNK